MSLYSIKGNLLTYLLTYDVRPFLSLSVFLSLCPSGMGVHFDHPVHFTADLSLWLDDLAWPWMAVSRIARYLCGSCSITSASLGYDRRLFSIGSKNFTFVSRMNSFQDIRFPESRFPESFSESHFPNAFSRTRRHRKLKIKTPLGLKKSISKSESLWSLVRVGGVNKKSESLCYVIVGCEQSTMRRICGAGEYLIWNVRA